MADPEPFAVFVREDNLTPVILSDPVFLREMLYAVWRNAVEHENGTPVSREHDLHITRFDAEPIANLGPRVIRATGLARRSSNVTDNSQ